MSLLGSYLANMENMTTGEVRGVARGLVKENWNDKYP